MDTQENKANSNMHYSETDGLSAVVLSNDVGSITRNDRGEIRVVFTKTHLTINDRENFQQLLGTTSEQADTENKSESLGLFQLLMQALYPENSESNKYKRSLPVIPPTPAFFLDFTQVKEIDSDIANALNVARVAISNLVSADFEIKGVNDNIAGILKHFRAFATKSARSNDNQKTR